MSFKTKKISEFPKPEIEKWQKTIWVGGTLRTPDFKNKGIKWFWIFWLYIVAGLVIGLLLLNWVFDFGFWGKVEEVKHPRLPEIGDKTIQIASWYDYDLRNKSQKCRRNDCYSKFNLTAASRDYPRGSKVEVCHQGKCIVVRVNDFGPEEWTGRDIDLSSYAFKQLNNLKIGLLEVQTKLLN